MARQWTRWLATVALVMGCTGTTVPTASVSRQSPPASSTIAPASDRSAETPTANAKAFRIVGYVTDSDGLIAPSQLDKLTHVNYAFLIPREDGTVADIANPWKLDEIVGEAHTMGVKVLISVGGWGWDRQFEALARAAATRATFVSALQRFVDEHALDGADIDWEYPDPGQSSENYAALMRELRTSLTDQKLLTSAVAVGANGEGIPTDVFGAVDFFNVMAYDGPGTNHSSYRFAQTALDYWSGRGLAKDKMVLGVPFYSRPVEVPYRKLVAATPDAANADEVEYMGDTVYYNGIPTMRQKTALALGRASGMMIWTVSEDTTDETSLLSAIYDAARAGATP